MTALPTVKDQPLVQFGLVEAAGVNSITDFNISKPNEENLFNDESKEDFANTLICHFVFYVVLCVSLFLHLLIDLRLASFIKNIFQQLIGLGKKTFLKD